jgi:tRNA pseudouridine55 synthase
MSGSILDCSHPPEGVLLFDKPSGRSSFSIVHIVRKKTRQSKVGHAGTLDPFATGLLILLLGRTWTRMSNFFLNSDKEYRAVICLGASTNTYDRDGDIILRSTHEPPLVQVVDVLSCFQGEVLQTPPMFSAKKVAGTRLYELARKGIEVERKQQAVKVRSTLESYEYPFLTVHFACSKGAYIRSFVQEIGEKLGCHAHTQELRRLQSGSFSVENSITLQAFDDMEREMIQKRLLKPLL